MAGSATEGSVVFLRSTAGPYDVLPAAAQAVLGQYEEDGHNHGRRTYRRQRSGAQRGLAEVVLFFWDARDGRDVAGWWIGDKVGGGQVWAHSKSMSAVPPQRGWRCPTDGPEQRHVLCETRGGRRLLHAKEEAAASPNTKRAAEAPQRAAEAPPWKRRATAPSPPLVMQSSLGEDAASERVRPLLGEYALQAARNHGRPTYLKQEAGGEPVWLYYWDHRDGRESSGWWLGRAVGGQDVFGRAAQHGSTPPAGGWHIPHDGPARSDVSLLPRGQEEEAALPEEDRLRRARALAAEVAPRADKALATASSLLGGKGDPLEEAVRAVAELLKARVVDLEAAWGSLARHQASARKQGLAAEACDELAGLEEKLRGLLDRSAAELERTLERLAAIEQEAAADRDAKAVETALPLVMESVAQAEIAAELAGSEGAAEEARQQIAKALTEVSEVLDAAQGYGPKAKRVALAEFGSLRARCEDAELRLSAWSAGSSAVPSRAAPDAAAGAADAAEDPEASLMAMAVEPPAEDLDEDLAEAAAAVDSDDEDPAAVGDLVARVTTQVLAVEAKAQRALDTAQAVLLQTGSEADDDSVRLCCDLLSEQVAAATKAEKACARRVGTARLRGNGGAVAALEALARRVEAERGRLTQELDAAQSQLERSRRQAREERETKAAELALPAAEEAVLAAEDAVEAVVFEAGDVEWRRTQLATGVEHAREYGEEIRKALDSTQAAAEAAQAAIAAARARLQVQIRIARHLPEDQQKASQDQINQLRRRLAEAQEKLVPYKQARSDYDEQLSAKEELEGLDRRMAAAEAEVEAVAAVLAEAAFRAEDGEASAARSATKSAQAALGKVMKLVEDRAAAGLGARLRGGLEGLRDRGMAAKAKLAELTDAARLRGQRASAEALLRRGRREAEKAEVWLGKFKQVQEPFACAEVLPAAQAAPALAAADALAAEAHPAVQACKTSLLELQLEAKQIPEGLPRLEAAKQLQALLARVDAVALAATQLKVDTFAHRTLSRMAEVVKAVVAAEEAAGRAREVAAPLEADNLEVEPSEGPARTIKEACAKVAESLKASTAACAGARQAVERRRQDPENRTSPSFHTQLNRLADRLRAAEASASGLGRCVKEAAGNRKLLQAQKQELTTLEAAVEEVELLALPLGDERLSEEAEEPKAARLLAVHDSVLAFRARAEALADNPHGGMKLAMGRLLLAAGKLLGRLAAARAGNSACERALCRVFLKEGRDRLAAAAAAMARAEETEGPFLTGIETLSSELHSRTVAACEAATAEAELAAAELRRAMEGRLREVATFGCAAEASSGRASAAALGSLLEQCAGLEGKLEAYKRDVKDRKQMTAGR